VAEKKDHASLQTNNSQKPKCLPQAQHRHIRLFGKPLAKIFAAKELKYKI
jgi:hypothetical protein